MATILIVEDELIQARALEAEIAALGHELLPTASKMSEAMDALARFTPDAALLDLRLGAELSYPIAATLKERTVPFAFLTGYDDQSVDTSFAPVTVLRKPVSREDIRLALRALLPGG